MNFNVFMRILAPFVQEKSEEFARLSPCLLLNLKDASKIFDIPESLEISKSTCLLFSDYSCLAKSLCETNLSAIKCTIIYQCSLS